MNEDVVIRLKKINGSLSDMEWLTVIEAAYEIQRLRTEIVALVDELELSERGVYQPNTRIRP